MVSIRVRSTALCIGLLVGAWTPRLDAGQETTEFSEPPAIKAAQPKVMVIELSDDEKYMVDQVQADFITDSLKRAQEEAYDHVILRIDTFGGVVLSARDINEALLRLKIPTTAYIATKAISAGVFIAWACDRIVMEPLTTLGDAQVIMQTLEGGIEEAPEKIVTVYRSDWEKTSEAKGRSYEVARGFFEIEQELLAVAGDNGPEFMFRPEFERRYGQIPEADRPQYEVLAATGELLTLHAEKAARLGLVELSNSFEEYLQTLGVSPASVEHVNMTFNQKVLRFIGVNQWVFFVLVLIGLNGLYMEIKAPGFGIPGLTAIVCFTIVFGTRYLLGTASSFEVLIFVVGLLLCLAEIFLTPGVGVIGLIGLIFIFGALILASFPDFGEIPTQDFQWAWLFRQSLWTLGAFATSIVAVFFVAPAFFALPFVQRRMLPNVMNAEDGYVMDTVAEEGDMIGLRGRARGDLHPVGKAIFDNGRLLDVVTEGVYIEDGCGIHVHRVEGNRIIVRPLPAGESKTAGTANHPASSNSGERATI